ncbi:MAG TPA: GatB/YqeY domain-containing protein, partial [Dehalococcoidia bacterium]|nr:GatB/YqeY domain-containing protein [Dehalococcoidia bacterium]
KAVADYRAGKQAALKALIGPVMKATRGRADPGLVATLLQRELDKDGSGGGVRSAPDSDLSAGVPIPECTMIDRQTPRLEIVGTRWIGLLLLGVLVVSFGVAYLLRDVYTVYTFPDWVYFATLGFLDRFVRAVILLVVGALFILGSLVKLRSVWGAGSPS